MDFQSAMRSLYRGYLYQLVLVLALVLLEVVFLVMAALQPSVGGAGLAAVVVASAAFVIALLIAVVVVFFLYILRGYAALYKMGFRWAWWLAWGTVVLFIVIIVGFVAIVAYYQVLTEPWLSSAPPSPYSFLASLTPLLAYLAVIVVLSLVISIARIILLRDLYNYTKIERFRTAYILYIVMLVLLFIPLASLVGIVLAFVQYIVEMLAYRDAAGTADLLTPRTPPPSTPPPSKFEYRLQHRL
ncbi:MAG: hypothetical protein ABWK05_08650 [Pyrobaculum sp.]